jgi:succinate dehydrogenase / fumarate reductase membrane anchor subunit
MNYHTPLKKAKGLGSARSGSGHFWKQRMTANAMLGLEVIIQDYVHTEWRKMSAIGIMRFSFITLAIAAIVAIFKITSLG